ncbi:MAG: BamA/TamA family outer membrane protein [Candidatus Kapabacteria bacterium]|nr:BamA/TamA family outer membrane protein [Candidatus Kapabacteria bacterium]MDW8012384.1 BamA/TamA family outer membrane protein [Bacteroidota bacterium]
MLSFAAIATATVLLYAPPALGQFGKNKVQYQRFTWQYLRSPHLDVYFTPGGEYLARFAAIVGERALQSIQRTVGHRITRRIALIVYNSHAEFQQTNVVGEFLPEGVGGVTELFKNRVVVPFEGNYEQFRHVIHHELVHAVLNDMFYGGSLQNALLRGTSIELPLWMNEGLCEFESLGGYDTRTDMFMRDLALSEELRGLESLEGYLAYRGGQAFYWYVATKYGREKIAELLQRLKVQRNLNAAFRSAFKMDFEDFSRQWAWEMKKMYWPDIGRFEDVRDFAQRLTDRSREDYFYNTSPALSPDGSRLAFLSDRAGVFGLYLMETQRPSARPRLLVSSGRERDFEQLNLLTPGIAWDPQGKTLAVAAKVGGENAIYLLDVATGSYKRLQLGFKAISSVAWSPDGSRLLFVATRNEQPDLWIYELKSGQLENLTDDVFTDLAPCWSPDGSRIYFVSDRGDVLQLGLKNQPRMWERPLGISDIYELNLSTRQLRRLTFSPDASKTSLAATPDGNALLFVSDANGIGNVWKLDLQTGKLRPLTNSAYGILQISISADGSLLAMSVQLQGGYDLFLLRFPLERSLPDTLPLTSFRQRRLSSAPHAPDTAPAVADTATAFRPYATFTLDFHRQRMVLPNPDALTSTPEDLSRTSGNDTILGPYSYRLSFSPDIVLGTAGYNTFFGLQGVTQMLFSDVLGDHQLYAEANLMVDLKNSNFLATYAYLPEPIDYQFTLFHQVGYVVRANDSLYRFRAYGLWGDALYPFDRFNRLEWGLGLLRATRENLDNIEPPFEAPLERTLVVPTLRYVHDDVVWGFLSPLMGSRYYVAAQLVPKLLQDGIGFVTFRGDYRYYLRLGRWSSLALRLAGGASFGTNPQKFFTLSTDNWLNPTFPSRQLPYDLPEDFVFATAVLPLRGYGVSERMGSKFVGFNLEARLPFLFALWTSPTPLLVQAITGVVFVDAAALWDSRLRLLRRTTTGDIQTQDLLVSTGIGMRVVLFGFPFRFDIAWRFTGEGFSKPHYLLSLGYDF